MKKILLLFTLVLSISIFAQKIPEINKTTFTIESLQDTVLTQNNESLTIKEVIEKHQGKIKILDLYAVWCGDCIKGLPKLKELQTNNPDVVFIYLSMDKTEDAWKNGIEKYQLNGENYYMGNQWKNNFSSYIDLNWIPRYLVIDKDGNIAKYYAVTAEDPEVQNTINKLRL